MKLTLFAVLSASFLFASLSKGFSQAGALDVTFGKAGKVITDFGGDDYGTSVAIQSNGKIIVAGKTGPYFGVVRYNDDGSTDSSFGIEGKVITVFVGRYNDGGQAVAIQPDGKIVVVGIANDQFGIIRYDSTGNLDNSFGNNGEVITNVGRSVSAAYSVTIQPDGKILVAGTGNSGNYVNVFFLVRYNDDGSLDNTFNSDGEVITTFGAYRDASYSAILQDDGKIVQGGFKDGDSLAVVRYGSNGLIDSSFGNNGKQIAANNTFFDFGFVLALQKDGKIIGSCTSTDSIGNNLFSLIRFNSNGLIDSTFGINGRAYAKINNSANAYAVALRANNKIVQVGVTNNNLGNDFALVQYNDNGIIDSTFGIYGKTETDFNNSDDWALSVAIQSDGKIITAGYSYNGSNYDFALARYNSENSLPITLSSFSATKKQTSILLNWQTANEQNNAYFIVERSNSTNTKFREVGRINSKGNSNHMQQYSFEDLNPFNGANYYRLTQVDRDGKSTYSKVVVVDFSKTITIKLYPNPARDILTLEGLRGITNISIIGLQGSILAKATTTNSSYTWSVKQLPAGTYYARIEADKNVTTLKFMKE